MNIKITDAVKHLLIINVLFFLIRYTSYGQVFHDLMAMHYIDNPLFKPWQIVSHMFMHGSEKHLLFNMFGLWMFGSAVEGIIGTKKILILYFIAGLGSVFLNFGIDWFQFQSVFSRLLEFGLSSSTIQSILDSGSYDKAILEVVSVEELFNFYSTYKKSLVGASGALYGIMVAFGVLMPKSKMGLLFLPIMIEARIFIPLLLLYDMSFGLFSVNDGIGHFAHIGGAIAGFIVIQYLKKHQFKRWN